MDAIKNKRRKTYDSIEGLPFVSPYVQINNDFVSESTENTPLMPEGGSINSFLDEAEIISPINEQNTVRAHDRMRKKIIYHFMNPFEKWNTKYRFPWKLCLQIVKIVMVTTQLFVFAASSYRYVTQHLDMTTALSRYFLKDWTSDVTVYPPEGPYAVYTIPEFYDNADNVIKQFSKVTELPIAPYSYDNQNETLTPIEFCIKQYDGEVFPGNSTIVSDGKPKDYCKIIPPVYPKNSELWDNFTLETFLRDSNFSINFRTLIKAQLHFKLRTIFIKSMTKLDIPECYKSKIHVSYDNSEHDGQILVSLNIKSKRVHCYIHSKSENDQENMHYLLRQVLNSIVIIFCLLSAVLCLRSLYSGYRIARETIQFFKEYYQKDIPTWELLDFVDFWYVNIIISDIMLVFGSLIKLQIEENSAEIYEYSRCSILLGVGNLLIWVGLLRYLGFFPKYNMLILSVKRALPNVLRFTLCAFFLFLGFCFCGCLVLGPYHIKFQTLSSTAECLFSVMNGDDMFATFALVNTKNNTIWWFSRIYLYLFLLLYIYVVISLFISVIMDTFETVKMSYVYGSTPKTTVEIFLATESYSFMPTAPLDEEEITQNILSKTLSWLKVHLHI